MYIYILCHSLNITWPSARPFIEQIGLNTLSGQTSIAWVLQITEPWYTAVVGCKCIQNWWDTSLLVNIFLETSNMPQYGLCSLCHVKKYFSCIQRKPSHVQNWVLAIVYSDNLFYDSSKFCLSDMQLWIHISFSLYITWDNKCLNLNSETTNTIQVLLASSRLMNSSHMVW